MGAVAKERFLFIVGGIHGVGKSTTCKRLCNELGIAYLNAGALIRGESLDSVNSGHHKVVQDIGGDQEKLLTALRLMRKSENKYLLDGHFVLISRGGIVQKIDHSIFDAIAPAFILLLTDDIVAIKLRLETRGGLEYSRSLLEEMQKMEIEHGRAIAARLHVSLSVFRVSEYDNIKAMVKSMIDILGPPI